MDVQNDIMGDSDYRGATWTRVDLHLHSPMVSSFKLPGGIDLNSAKDRANIAEKYAGRLKEAEIKIGAITDYNGIGNEWFELIRDKAKEADIKIFPGVELSLTLTGGKYGLHLLLIFEKDVNINGLNRFLHSLDKNPQVPLFTNREHRDIESKYELEDLITEIRGKYKCLVIFAHPKEDKGLLTTYNPSQAADYLMKIKPDAVEYMDEIDKGKLLSTHKVTDHFLKNLAIIENTDPKSIEEIGGKKRSDGRSRATYLKLSAFTIDAMKMALHDPEVRVKVYEYPAYRYDQVSRVEIKGAAFLKDVQMMLNPELNTLIGGRGVGKSAIIEAMRYAMNLPVYADKSARIEFVESVVGSGGEVRVSIDRFYGEEKKEFIISRVIGKDTQIYENGRKTDFSINSLFEEGKYPIVMGQKELYQLSITPVFQLKLVDELIGAKLKKLQQEFIKLLEDLKENGRRLNVIGEKASKKFEYEQRLKEIVSQIKVFQDLGVEEKLRRWNDLVEDEERLNDTVTRLNTINDKIKEFFSEHTDSLLYAASSLRNGKSEGKSILEKVALEVDKIREQLHEAETTLTSFIATGHKNITAINKKWIEKKAEVEREVQKIKIELAEKKLEPDKLERLTIEKAKLISLIDELKKIGEEINKLEIKREDLKEKINGKRKEIFDTRQKQVDKINRSLEGRLKITVKFEEEKEDFKSKIKDLLRGSKVSDDAVNAIVYAQSKLMDGMLLSKYIKEGSEKIQGECGITPAMAERLIKWFEDKEKLNILEMLFPDDKIEISLRVDKEYKALEKLSIGQKATALLLLLFVQERILIFDQPEEDLDNRFVYEDVVRILRDLKMKRQIIVATHNANIPVLGDSELIAVLESENDECIIKNKGSIDKNDVRADVKNIMEGGEEAFRVRAEKYGGIYYG